MKHVRYFTKAILMAGFCLVIGACSNDELLELEQDKTQNESITHTIRMEFIGDVVGFDQQSNGAKVQTRATSLWNDGDKIFVTFFNGSTIIPGEATYQSSKWSINIYGDLPIGSFQKCEARFFVEPEFISPTVIKLTYKTAVFEDVNATYSYDGESLSVQAQLKPKTGRLYFNGTPNTKLNITGLSVLSSFSVVNNSFSTSTQLLSTSVTPEGSTPYIYAILSDTDRKIGLIGPDFAYTRVCSSEILKPGESGYMAIPTESVHNTWNYGLSVKANGVEFKMMPVAGHRGGFFLIGETEVTEALYSVLNGTSSTSMLPVSEVGCYQILSFISKLNSLTKLSFSIPNSDQWKYAASGGKQSLGYNYSGSDNLNEVAWHSGNTNSKQVVKTKNPNELGIYDMNGNVSEFTDISLVGSYNDYYSFSYYGGSYTNSPTNLHLNTYGTASATNDNSKSTDRGFRLIMTIP